LCFKKTKITTPTLFSSFGGSSAVYVSFKKGESGHSTIEYNAAAARMTQCSMERNQNLLFVVYSFHSDFFSICLISVSRKLSLRQTLKNISFNQF
jgi:hypothetical protein